MTFRTWALWAAAFGGLAGACASYGISDRQVMLAAAEQTAEKSGKPAGSSGGPPPLVVNKDAPLLLLEQPKKAPAAGAAAGPVADNEACYVCHGNYRDESLAGAHAKANVGCAKCHGQSLDHRNDEDNVIPPDVMYAPADIDAACHECHKRHNVPAREVIALWKDRCPAKSDPAEIVCTDCHGEHRRPFRVVRWDKKTRQLIVQQDPHDGAAGGHSQQAADLPAGAGQGEAERK